MLHKIYTTISSWLFSPRTNKSQPQNQNQKHMPQFLITSKHPKKQRFILLPTKSTIPYKIYKNQPSLSSNNHQPTITQLDAPIIQSAQDLQSYYYKLITLQQTSQNTAQQQLQQRETEEFLEKLRIINQDQKMLEDMLDRLTIGEQERGELEDGRREIGERAREMEEALRNYGQTESLYEGYLKIIEHTLSYKYKRELQSDYRAISFEEYKLVLEDIWKTPKQPTKLVPNYPHLKLQDLKLLTFREWLNDQLITAYTTLLLQTYQKAYYQNQPSSQSIPKILDSLQSKSIFEKSDHSKIARILAKNKIVLPQQTMEVPYTQRIFVVIHKINHWLFLVVDVGRCQISIYDSMRSNINDYMKFRTIANIINYFNAYYRNMYGAAFEMKVNICENYPQQRNGYDCGIMVLCGIRDLLRKYRMWTFSQGDMKYRRVLVTLELYYKQIYGV